MTYPQGTHSRLRAYSPTNTYTQANSQVSRGISPGRFDLAARKFQCHCRILCQRGELLRFQRLSRPGVEGGQLGRKASFKRARNAIACVSPGEPSLSSSSRSSSCSSFGCVSAGLEPRSSVKELQFWLARTSRPSWRASERRNEPKRTANGNRLLRANSNFTARETNNDNTK